MTNGFEVALGQDALAMTEYLQGLSAEQRRATAPTALRWYKTWWASFGKPVDGVSHKALSETASLGVLGTASFHQIKKSKVIGTFSEELAVSVLRQRQPDWLQDYAEWFLESVPTRFGFIRRLEKEGLITRPDTPFYIMGLIVAAARGGALSLLQEDPELINEVPLLFETEGAGENSLAAFDKYQSDERSWNHALLVLSENGTLKRSDLLHWSLAALNRDFATFRAGWFSRFHEALQPTDSERATLKDAYLELLGSSVEPTVSFALKALVKVAKKVSLPQKELSLGLESVWLSPKKGTANLGLKLLSQISDPEVRSEHLTQAVLHTNSSIVESAFKELKKLHPHPKSSWTERWLEIAQDLPASIQGDWGQWLGKDLESPKLVTQVTAPPYETSEEAVECCQSVDEVFQLAMVLLEDMDQVWDLERLLDGMLRFIKPQGPRIPALRKRALQRLNSGHATEPLARLILTWLGEPAGIDMPQELSLSGFLRRRLAEIQSLLAGAVEPKTLLSLPESRTGFVDLNRLMTKLFLAETQPTDFAQALFRLPPDANSSLVPLDSEAGKIVAFALGASVGRPKSGWWPFGKKSPLDWCWKVAEQCRAQRVLQPWDWDVETTQHTVAGKTYTHRRMHIKILTTQEFILSWLDDGQIGHSGWRRWESTVFPAAKEFWLCRGIVALANNIDWWEADWADIVYLEALSNQREQWSLTEAKLAVLGLACQENGQFGLSVELVGSALGTGLLTSAVLGQALAVTCETQLVKMNRWAKAFNELTLFAPLVPLCEALEIVLEQAPSETNLGQLLPPYLEMAAACKYRIKGAKARASLEKFGAKSVAGKAAQALLGF